MSTDFEILKQRLGELLAVYNAVHKDQYSCSLLNITPDNKSPEVQDLQYGFKWGITKVERCASHNGHVVISIETPKNRFQVRVTPTGFIRPDDKVDKCRRPQNE